MAELGELFDPAAMHAFEQPGAVRHGLPAFAYTSEGFRARENERLFPSGWTFVGFAHELSEPGDVIPTTVADAPVLLVRNRELEVKVFHNVCRHRCLKLVDAPRNVGRHIQCPYHHWTYGLDGELRASPHFGGNGVHVPAQFDAAAHGLVPIRAKLWGDWVFVNLDGNAPPFEEYAAPLMARLADLDLDALVPLTTLEFGAVQTNWKFLMENFMEPYHVQYVHPSTTSQPLADHRTVIDGRCLGSIVDLAEEGAGTASLAVSSRYLTLFPNFVLGRYHPDQLGVYLNVPLSAGRTVQRRVIYSTGERRFSPAEVEGLARLWHDVHKEDHAMCERLQQGRASRVAADGGRLSPVWEDCVRRFQELVVAAVR